jgi:UDP-N-acetylmuramoyl-L-alanyl-D-glutamate--2,6-diaminopimelate ligase
MAARGEVPLTLELGEVAGIVSGRLHGPPETAVRGLTHDSRRVAPGMLFCALPGLTRDGSSFAAEALARGAAALLAETVQGTALPAAPWVEVEHARKAIATLSHRFYAEPSRELAVVGITGTNGKTTTSFLVGSILEQARGSSAVLGTLGLRRGERVLPTGFTTPEAPELASLMSDLLAQGIGGLAMEVSSHALAQSRVEGVRFTGGIFTNLTHEHLDYHGSLEAYREAKLLFFDLLREVGAWAVLNLDDPAADEFRRRAPSRLLTYSQEIPEADVFAERVELEPAGSLARVVAAGEPVEVRVGLGGRYNLSNALAALAAGLFLGLNPEQAAGAIARVRHVPGRFEVYHGGGRTVLIDYAHTPDAFQRVLTAARQLTRGRLHLIFGCGGERDREKRPVMGEIAGRMADEVYVTLDNARGEPLDRIDREIAVGLARTNATWARHDDRAGAIRLALERSRPGDLVVLLGKGDESYQEVNGVKHPYSDREVARRELDRLSARGEKVT